MKIRICQNIALILYRRDRVDEPTADSLAAWANTRRDLFPDGMTVAQAQNCIDNPSKLFET